MPPSTSRRGRRLPRTVLVVVLAGVAAVGWVALHRAAGIASACTAVAGNDRYTLDPEQGVNATTIAAEARRQGLPAHAVSVGLAAALQESKLHNLDYGDRDSLGLFQQRPSQGWGRPDQLVDPSYAAAAFFRGLRKVPGWQDLPIFEAAQRVQHSAAAEAYAAWDTESRTIARGLTGETPAGFTCRFASVPRSTAATRTSLLAGAQTALGAGAFAADPDAAHGWLVASWLVARARTYSVESIRYAGWTWTPGAAGWRRDPGPGTTAVTWSLRPAD